MSVSCRSRDRVAPRPLLTPQASIGDPNALIYGETQLTDKAVDWIETVANDDES